MPKTNQELWDTYKGHNGNACPKCGSTNISSIDFVQADGMSAWQDIACRDCGAEWQDLYTLTGIDLLADDNAPECEEE
jgi:DNA-directed RNA polymerase subunit RPC12/RpoP